MSKRGVPEFKITIKQSPNAEKTFEEILHSKEMKNIVRDIVLTKKALKT